MQKQKKGDRDAQNEGPKMVCVCVFSSFKACVLCSVNCVEIVTLSDKEGNQAWR